MDQKGERDASCPSSSADHPNSRSLPNMATASGLSSFANSISSTVNTENRIHTWGPRVLAEQGALRPVVIDGSNVAMQLGKRIFATRGILICARYFISKGHQVITFVPQYRRTQHPNNYKRPMTDQHLLDWMYDREILIYTPSRYVTCEENRRLVICYDDFYIVQYAHDTGGVVVSKDQYRDVLLEHPEWGETVRNRLVMFSWAGEHFMPASDPFGRLGPRLNDVLRYGPNDRVAPFKYRWTNERREQLLREIDEVLSAPPPPPPPPPGADNGSSGAESQESSSMTDLVAASSAAIPRYGFARKEGGGGFGGFNHRSRRWMQQGDLGMHPSAPAPASGFGPVTNGWRRNDCPPPEGPGSAFASPDLGPNDNGEHPTREDSSSFLEWFADETLEDEDFQLAMALSSSVSDMALPEPPDPDPGQGPGTTATAASAQPMDDPPTVPSAPIIESPLVPEPQLISTVEIVMEDVPEPEAPPAPAAPEEPPSKPTATDPANAETEGDLYKRFADVFPSEIVQSVLSQHSKIQNLDLLSNLMADALIRQSH